MQENDIEFFLEMFEEIKVLLPGIIAVVIVYAVELKFARKLGGGIIDRKIEEAKKRGQIVQATYIGKELKEVIYDDSKYTYGKYQYSLNGKRHIKLVRFRAIGRIVEFPPTINVYYLGSKVYTEYDIDISGVWYAILPFLAGALVLYITRRELFV